MSAVRAIHGPVKIVPSESQVLPETRLVEGRPTLHEITSGIAHPLESRPGKAWWICLALAVAALLNLGGMVAYRWARALEYGDSTTASAGLLTSRILYSGSVLDTLAL